MRPAKILWLLASTAGAVDTRRWAKPSAVPNHPSVQFGSDRRLSITVFSDLHFGEPDSARGRHGADLKTVGVMNSVLDNEHTNLVVLNGDLISCEWVAPGNANTLIDQIVAPLVNRNLPFAATFGNHDASQTCSTRSMSDHMREVKGSNGQNLSFTSNSVPGELSQVGSGNYFVPIYSSSDGGHLKMLLWFFDSKGGRVYQPGAGDVSVANWVDEKVVSWFRQTNNKLRQQHDRAIPSLAFVHIPIQATFAFQQHGSRTATTEPGLSEELIGHQADVCDNNGNNCGYTGADSPFTKALVETEGLMAVFSGHDHGVDWCMKWDKNLPNTDPTNGNGLHICFNRHSGYGGYTDWARGARQIVVEEDKLGRNELETWIRLEDGRLSGRVSLNSTYGTDHYPKAKKLKSFGLKPRLVPAAMFVDHHSKTLKPKPKPTPILKQALQQKPTSTSRTKLRKPKPTSSRKKSKPTPRPNKSNN